MLLVVLLVLLLVVLLVLLLVLTLSLVLQVLNPQQQRTRGGPNHIGVAWAVYFYKPYCGACRRIRPAYESLGRLTNATEHLRFASIDCVKFRQWCDREGVETQPRVRIYHAVNGYTRIPAVTSRGKSCCSRCSLVQ